MSLILEKQQTTSTNDDAKLLAAEGCEHLTVVWAHNQTSGRGRHGRQWVSTEGNVFWSIILRPSDTWPTISELVYVNALAVYNAIGKEINYDAGLTVKWPNDLLLNERKIAGSLLECSSSFQHGVPEWVVIGTGVNVAHHPNVADMQYPPTSLAAEGYTVSRDVIIHNLLVELQREVEAWLEKGFKNVKERYLRLAHKLNEQIHVGISSNKDGYYSGQYVGIDDSGCLLLDADVLLDVGRGGKQRLRLSAGDVIIPDSHQ